MTDTTTRPIAGGPDVVDDDLEPLPATPPAPRRRRKDTPVEAFFHRAYALFHNKKFGLFLILAMTVLTLVGVLLPQAAPDIRSDPQAYADWLSTQRPKFGGWTPVLDTLGFFGMFGTVWFKAVTVLLALSIVACTTHRMPVLWANATRPHLHVTEGFFDHAKVRETTQVRLSPAQTVTELRRILGKRHFRVLDDPKGEGFSLYADRYRWMPFGTVIAHTSFVVLLFGMLVSANTGFDENLAVTVGTRVPVGHGTNYSIEAKSFSDTYHATGQAMDYVADVVLYDGDTPVAANPSLRVNSPLHHDGLRIHQSYFGTSAVVTVKNASGATVFAGGVPLEYTSDDEQNSIGRAEIPGTDLVAFVVTPASGQVISDIPAGQAQIEVQRRGQEAPVATGRLAVGETRQLGDHTYTFEREAKFTGLMVREDPGAPWIWVGCALMMIGLVTTMGFKHRRVWVRVHPTTVDGEPSTEMRAATSDKADLDFQKWFRRFATEVSALGPQTATGHAATAGASTDTTTHTSTNTTTGKTTV
ncbi:cytochrome c biogenesis protein ResB [Mobilicoccus massiliensis]|uniref:cytochrome c biogenesis protein ResB n=1 Tax=Mobilicoccus massiliensis TaxID=1522310 RepID=UPI0006934FD3|nr:cytochrome c biogenesis protein ResB [Mobilicoccus massiliensis]